MMKWKRVENKLPKQNGDILMYDKITHGIILDRNDRREYELEKPIEIMITGKYEDGKFFEYDEGEWIETHPTHWMPLPKPPKGSGE